MREIGYVNPKPGEDRPLRDDEPLLTFTIDAYKLRPPTPLQIRQLREEGWIDADQYTQMMRSVVPPNDPLTGTTS
jgi:hypothetical protein